MARRRFLLYPDPRLKAVAAPVKMTQLRDFATIGLWNDMLAAMYAMPGVGLAAPQIGVSLRLAVLDCSASRDAPVRLANPEIVGLSDEVRAEVEASPNLPGVAAEVARPVAARVRFLTPEGETVERDFAGLWARSVQHQIDHLDGRLFVDRLGPVRRRMLLDRARKLGRRGARAG